MKVVSRTPSTKKISTTKQGGLSVNFILYHILYIYIHIISHKSNFKTRNPKNATGLSKYIWKLQDQAIDFDISWKIVSRAKPFNHVTKVCQLCTREKYFIIFKPEMASINERSEIAGPCLHKHGKLLKKS